MSIRFSQPTVTTSKYNNHTRTRLHDYNIDLKFRILASENRIYKTLLNGKV